MKQTLSIQYNTVHCLTKRTFGTTCIDINIMIIFTCMYCHL